MLFWLSSALVLLAVLQEVSPGPACRISEYPCRNGKCIKLNSYCDGLDDCGDTSDEPMYCTDMDQKFPFQILDSGVSLLNHKYVLVGPKKYCLPNTYKNFAEAFYNFEPRNDDVWLFGIPRSGTTLTQELVWLIANDLNFEKASENVLDNRFPYLETVLFWDEKKIQELAQENNANNSVKNIATKYEEHSIYFLEKTTNRRFIKSHIAMSLNSPKLWTSSCKIIYCLRDPRDVIVSNFHFYRSIDKNMIDVKFETFWNVFKSDKLHFLPYFENVKEGWEKRNEQNVLFLRYEETNKNKRETIKKIAKFLDKELTEEQIDKLEEHILIDKFSKNKSVNNDHLIDLGIMSSKKEDKFIRKGKVGGWKEYFTGNMENEVNEWMKNNLKDTDLTFS